MSIQSAVTIATAVATAIAALLTVIFSTTREKSRLRTLERLSKLRPKLPEQSGAHEHLEKLETLLAKKMYRHYNYDPWKTFRTFAATLLAVVLAALLLAQFPHRFLLTTGVTSREVAFTLHWVAGVAGILAVLMAGVSIGFFRSEQKDKQEDEKSEASRRKAEPAGPAGSAGSATAPSQAADAGAEDVG